MKGYTFAYQIYVEQPTEQGVEVVLCNVYKKGAVKRIVPVSTDIETIEDELVVE